MHMPRQERIKSVIIGTRPEFRTMMVSYINQAGFSAEKRIVSDVNETESLVQDELFWNYVIDLHDLSLVECKKQIKKLTELINDSRIHPLVYLAENSGTEVNSLSVDLPGAIIVCKPIARKHILDAFVKPYMARHGHLKKVNKADGQENALILATIVHVKDTLESLKKVSTDKKLIAEVVAIGQKFNGIFGTFNFFRSHPGHGDLANMAEIIECIGKTYSKNVDTNILLDAHFELLVDATKVSFNLLKIMRDGGAPDEVLAKRCQSIYKKFKATSDLFTRNDQSQKEVDSLLEKLGI
jgi:hypothetical protein